MPEAKFEYAGENLKDKSRAAVQNLTNYHRQTDKQSSDTVMSIIILIPVPDPNWTFVLN